MADITQDSLTVVVEGQTFVFRIPSPRDMAKMGSRALSLRRQDAPDTGGFEFGLDPFTQDLYRGFALMETLLLQADAKDNWPYSTGPEKDKPVVDCTKFPAFVTDWIPRIYQGFDEALRRFLKGGIGNGEQSGEEAVGGVPAA